jgi:purine catabolism regulator
MVVACGEPLDEARHLLIQQGAAAATVTLSRVQSVQRARRASVAELLDDVVEGRASRQRLTHRLEQLDLDPSKPYRVLTILPDDRRQVSALAAMLEDMAVSRVRAAVGTSGDAIHAITQPADAGVGTMLMTAVRRRGLPAPRIGRSRKQHDVDGLVVALRESLVAAERSSGGLLDVADLGVHGLLAGVAADAAADAFVTQMLGPVLAHDAAGDGVLVDTVRAYMSAGCRPGPAAEALNVHRHTLSYRLDRVTQLTGRDPRSGEHLLPYGIALELLDRRT